MALPTNITLNIAALNSMSTAPTGPVALFDSLGNVSIDLALTPTVHLDNTVTFGNGPVSGPWIGWVSGSTFIGGLVGSVYTLSGPSVYPVGG